MKLATLCYIKNNGSTLMLHRVKKQNDVHQGKWNGLGGKFEQGESPEDCAIREVGEESGLKIYEPRMRGFITFPNFDGKDDWHVFVFTADKFSGNLIDSKEGILKWIPDSELLDLNLWEGDRIFLKWVQEDRFFSAKFTYQNGLLQNYTVSFPSNA